MSSDNHINFDKYFSQQDDIIKTIDDENECETLPSNILECVFNSCEEGEWDAFLNKFYNQYVEHCNKNGKKIMHQYQFIPLARKHFLELKGVRSNQYLNLFANTQKMKKNCK